MSSESALDPRGQNMRDMSARTLDEVRTVPTETIRKALAALEENLGGREALVSILAQGAFTSDEEKFVAILGDPEERSTSLAKLMGVFGLSPAKFFKLLADSKATQAVFASMDKVYRRLPEVAEHTVERALPKIGACPACDGVGRYPPVKEEAQGKLCQKCCGVGSITTLPETEAIKLALQVGGLLKGGQQTTNVTLNQQVDARSLSVGAGAPSGDQRSIFRDFSQASDRVLYGRVSALPAATDETLAPESLNSESAPVDAEIVEP